MIDLEEMRRRLRAVSDETGALAALHDSDLLWLLANGWEPPGVEVPQPTPARPNAATEGAFVLTEEQFYAYRRKVREAQQIKELLAAEERAAALLGEGRTERVTKLRVALQEHAAELREMADGWEQS